ncbi:Type II secretion system (T2SS), protein F [Actinacidiphila yanglinensis]|uniref:Type II secretion system (T2SS), protein F n=1 Tax=Actinacidiphila yanglinensis TaxID=310779 RepID=A0A1H6ECJ0_9ACTN|nr:type II secretion system F family protein [Actinacidiphila yanglinensis]SEG94515.1 Type II secretion system (T2SS), protein F [Actinacidiphila yanglinensis]
MSGASVHSLGMTASVLAALCAGVMVRKEPRGGGVRRLRGVLEGPRPARAKREWRGRARGAGRTWLPVVAAALGAAVLVGGLPGGAVGILAGVGMRMALARRRAAAAGRAVEAGPDLGQLPLCADLMAACLAAGATPGEAAGAVGRCLDGPLGVALLRAEAELRLGGDPSETWGRFGRLPAARAMGRCLARASTTGSAPVAEMARLAVDYRAAHARSALARARRAAVLATAPLGVCFLPAFLLIGVAPVVMGLAGAVLGGPMGAGGG